MSITIRAAKTVSALALTAGVVVALMGMQPAEAGWQATATEGVNIRSGPSTAKSIIGGLYRGGTITALSSSSGWTKVRFNGDIAYISSKYLTKDKDLAAPSDINTGSVKITTTDLNVRKGPGLSYDKITTLSDGFKVTLTGKVSRGFAEVTVGDSKGWVSTQYLASSNGLPKTTGTRTATTDLLIRTTADADFGIITEVKKGAKLKVTGATKNGRAQIVYGNAVRWVTAKYLSNTQVNAPSVPKLPKITGTRYATTELMIRSTSSDNFKDLGDVGKGTKLKITGVIKSGRAQIVYDNAVRWVTAKYLSKTKPKADSSGGGSSGGGGPSMDSGDYADEKGLQNNTVKVHRAILEHFPQVKTFYGVRPGSWNAEHRDGRAIDIMVPNYSSSSGKALGDDIAAWLKKNHKSLGINYLIWQQRIWNIERNGEGWRWMADRGDDSANHYNHVHVTTYSSGHPAAGGSGQVDKPSKNKKKKSSSESGQTGTCKASFYDEPQETATGGWFDPEQLSTAHKSLPFGTKVKVTNLVNGKTVTVPVLDRGPYIEGRCLDLSKAAMREIGGLNAGVVPVKYEIL
ncbi:septal ring lytic transglycosylase RlpA family protein [Microlunatus speluncae]|uniref:septal ring lytic transglycosylase RlpA family protein n=1 Tax=Microlunatus speluncae TaxID=2594267 RepID=UPI001266630C|nr:septal ring lytic transglycosylase RlpA family protein [Microlunatus speluncae]